jgi:DNA-binding NtrC family response regulator
MAIIHLMSSKPTDLLNPETSVLIVDDSSDYSQVLQRILHNGLGYTSVVTIPSLDEAYRMITSSPDRFSMIFLDYHFPNGETGSSLIERLKEQGLLDSRVAFFVTAEPAVQKAIEVNDHGLAGVVIKPFNVEKLRALIQRVDRGLQMDRENEEFP